MLLGRCGQIQLTFQLPIGFDVMDNFFDRCLQFILHNILIALGRFNGPLSSLAGKSAIKPLGPKASFSMEPNDDSQLKLQRKKGARVNSLNLFLLRVIK